MRGKVVFLGLDGATWSILAPLIYAGELPNFRKLVSKSVVGTLQSTVPPVSPPAWTSMFTGVNPGKHGIVDFLLREGNSFVTCLTRYRMCKSIWQILSEEGRRCVVVNEPVTFPPEQINGIMTTGLMTPPGSGNWVYPRELKNEIDMVAGGYEPDIPSDFVSLLSKDRRKAAKVIEDLAVKVFRVSKHVASKSDWDILAVIFSSTDRLQHYWWDDKLEVTRHYKVLDRMLGDYIRSADEKGADLIVASDHGFGPTRWLFRLDKWLQKSGLTIYGDSTVSRTMSSVGLTKRGIAKHWRSWRSYFTLLPDFVQKAVRRVVPEGTRTPHLAKSEAYSIGVGVFVSRDKKEFVAKKLRELIDETTGKLVFEQVLDRDSVLQGPFAYRASDLFLQPSPEYSVFNGVMGLNQTIYTGNHRPNGIFLHYQQNRSPPPNVESVTVRPWDVAALILSVLGVRVPDYFDGKPPTYVNDR